MAEGGKMEQSEESLDQVSHYMGVIQIQKNVLNWMTSTDSKSRMGFAKIVLGILQEEELRQCMSKISKERKKIKRTDALAKKKAAQEEALSKRSVRGGSVKKHASVPSECSSKASVVSPGSERGVAVSTSEPLESNEGARFQSAQAHSKLKCWWHQYPKSQVVALDCEHIHLKEGHGVGRIKAGTVSIANHRQEIIYHARIYRAPGTFLTDHKIKKISGFGERSLVDGKPSELVTKEVAEILEGKLVITFDGATDFSSLDLFMGQFDVFDLNSHFKKRSNQITKYGEIIYQTVNLESVYFHFFQTKIQRGVYSCKEDAKATMKLFLEVYPATKSDKTHRSSEADFDQFNMINNIKKMF